jgi:hypothetical protein
MADVSIAVPGGGARFMDRAQVLSPGVRRFLIGAFLIVAFTLTCAVLLFVITAEQFQTMVDSPEFATLKVSTGWIRQDVAYLEHYWKEQQDIERKEDAARDALFQISVRSGKIRAQMSGAAEDTRNFIDLNDTQYILPPLKLKGFVLPSVAPPVDATLSVPSTEAPAAPASAPADANATQSGAPAARATPLVFAATPPASLGFGKAIDEYFEGYYAELDNAPTSDAARKSLNAFKTEVYKRLQKYFAARAVYESDSSTARALAAQITALAAQSSELDKAAQQPGTALANDAYWSLAENFRTFKILVGSLGYDAIALPRMMLVLALSIFMGILGSLIYISQDFLKNPGGRGFWDIVFRIGLGAGVAFALFFFAAAGMLALSQTKSGVQSDMSPYLIAFLGITGGYLSDRVTQWMREVGENTFKIKTDGPPDRWGVGLAEGLQKAGLDTAALASAAGVTATEAEAWVALTKAVPGDKQNLVAAFLREHPSRVFTDIAPG